MAAIRTPAAMAGIARFSCMSSIAAIRAPVQAPVPGSGIATKSIRPQNSYFKTFSLFLSALASILAAIPASHSLLPFIQLNILRMKTIMNGIGIKFPITAAITAVLMLRPAITPAGIPALSSSTGTIDMSTVMAMLPAVVPQSEIILFPLNFSSFILHCDLALSGG